MQARDLEQADVYLETFIVASWAEHLRQHERLTRGDRELEQVVASHARGEPVVRHLVVRHLIVSLSTAVARPPG